MTDLLPIVLPESKAPTMRRVGNLVLEACPVCKGSGRHRYSAISAGYKAERFSEPCPKCKGGGKRLRKAKSKKP